MSEPSNKLRAALDQLHSQLHGAGAIDPEIRKRLQGAMDEIRAVLEAPGERPSAKADHEPLIHRLTEAAGQFEVSHPTLSGTVERLIEALRQMGI